MSKKTKKLSAQILAIVLSALMVLSIAFYTIYMIVDNIKAKKAEKEKEIARLEKQMREAISDYRALKLLESLIGYDATLALCEELLCRPVDIQTLPETDEQLLSLREAVNARIERALREV